MPNINHHFKFSDDTETEASNLNKISILGKQNSIIMKTKIKLSYW